MVYLSKMKILIIVTKNNSFTPQISEIISVDLSEFAKSLKNQFQLNQIAL